MVAELRKIPARWLVLLGVAVWAAAGWLLSIRTHYVLGYKVSLSAVHWDWRWLVLAGLWAALAAATSRAARPTPHRPAGDARPALWLLACGIILLIEQMRGLGVLPERLREPTYLEPLWFAFCSGMAALSAVQALAPSAATTKRERLLRLAVVVVCVALGGWWFYQGHLAYSQYLLGFQDFGVYARRIANTWEGRGFLAMSPQWPAFNDHFSPGLLAVVPLWAVWPDAYLFIFLQAVCLTTPAPMIFGAARRLGARPIGAAAWSGAFLTYPAVGHLNVSLTYGWHDSSFALPLLMAAVSALFAGQRGWAAAWAIAACTFKEDIIAIVAATALSLAWLEAIERRRSQPRRLTGVSPKAWLAVFAGFTLAFFAVMLLSRLMGPAHTWRFQHLGDSPLEIFLSPVLRPRAFWGEIFQPSSAYFLLALLVPVGLPTLARGWPVLLSLAPPLGFLMAWPFEGATCIAMHYVTELIPTLFLAALLGAARQASSDTERGHSLLGAGVLALTTGAVASFFLGALPYSEPAFSVPLPPHDHAAKAAHIAILDRAVAMVDDPQDATLASSRMASHLLAIRRLETVFYAVREQGGLRAETGPDRNWIELFDWVALDLHDRFWNHSLADMHLAAEAAEDAGYRLVMAQDGVLVYRRPGVAAAWASDPLAPWRAPPAETPGPEPARDSLPSAPGLRVLDKQVYFDQPTLGSPPYARVELVLQADEDHPPEYLLRHVFRDPQGEIVADSGAFLPLGGNRPTSWWKRGERWRERYRLSFPANVDTETLTDEAELVEFQEPDFSQGAQVSDGSQEGPARQAEPTGP